MSNDYPSQPALARRFHCRSRQRQLSKQSLSSIGEASYSYLFIGDQTCPVPSNPLRVTTFGESHGQAVGCIVDGCPSRIPISTDDLHGSSTVGVPVIPDLTTLRRRCRRPVSILSGSNGPTPASIGPSIPTPTTARRLRRMETVPRPSAPISPAKRCCVARRYRLPPKPLRGRAASALAEKMLSVFHSVEIVA